MPRYLYYAALWLGLLLALVGPAAATHLVGGELSYRYLDSRGSGVAPYHYQLTATVYFNKEFGSVAPDGRPSIQVMVHDKSQPQLVLRQLTLLRTSFSEITPAQPAGCALTVPRVTVAYYAGDVYLPASSVGFFAFFSESARNIDLSNLLNPGSTGLALSMHLPPTPIVNTAPVFSDQAVAVICQNDTTFILNNAYDADGDRLEYSFGTPYGSGNGFGMNPIAYAAGYSPQQPFGPRCYVALSPTTGLASYFATLQGRFAVAVDVREYRNIGGQEVLLNTIRRDVQLVVRACPTAPTRPPTLIAPARSFAIEEGEEVSFDVEARLPGQQLTLKVSSVLLDAAGPFDATFDNNPGTVSTGGIGTVTLTGTGSTAGRFRFRAGCGTARATPYDIVVTAQNNACGGRNVGDVFRVLVTRAAGPGGIGGDALVCAYSTEQYTALSLNPPGGFLWTVRGGRIVGPAAGAAVQVQWGAGPAGRLTVRGLTAQGCPTDSAWQVVTLEAGPPIGGPTEYCPKTSRGLRYAVLSPRPGVNYQWSLDNGGVLRGGQGTAEVEVDIPDGRTVTLRVTDVTNGSCAGQLVVAPDLRCLAFYNVITPNGDGLNDAFVVEHLEQYPGSSLRIYSRWGRELYQSADYRNDWRGDTQPAGVYYYLLRLPDGRTFKGWFELMR